MGKNIQTAQKIINSLAAKGVRCFCLCPGGRAAPFVELLSRARGVEFLSFFDERSAGFFALGRAERDNRPVAVVCTSGTAVAQLLPSAIEAFYSGQALAFVTADRPLSFGQKGTPQTLKSALAVLQDYCGSSVNIEKPEDVKPLKWDWPQTSLHLNVCFTEPLIDSQAVGLNFAPVDLKNRPFKKGQGLVLQNQLDAGGLDKASFKKGQEPLSQNQARVSLAGEADLKSFFASCKKPLILVGGLEPKSQAPVKELLKGAQALFYTEPLSGLEALAGRLISHEKILKQALNSQAIDGLVRIGALPKARFWRDLENHPHLPVLSFVEEPCFSGLARSSFIRPLRKVLELRPWLSALPEYGRDFKEKDQKLAQKLKGLLEKRKQSEDFWLLKLKRSMPQGAKVFLGNSLPVRLWDSAAFFRREDLRMAGQSGVNGIDGLLSRFFGSCEPGRPNAGIFGDLSLLYDAQAFWRSKHLPDWTALVINNFGGRIFSRLFENPAFLNEHDLSFAPLAKMWRLNYELWEDSGPFVWPKKPYTLVEIRPDKKETEALFQERLGLFKAGFAP